MREYGTYLQLNSYLKNVNNLEADSLLTVAHRSQTRKLDCSSEKRDSNSHSSRFILCLQTFNISKKQKQFFCRLFWLNNFETCTFLWIGEILNTKTQNNVVIS